MDGLRSTTNWKSWKAARRICVPMAALVLTWAWTPLAMSAGLTEYALLQGKYESGMQRVVLSFNKNHGKYLGSGAGEITGKVSGSVAWDLYEEQSRFRNHRIFRSRQADKTFWDLTSAIRFYDAQGQAYSDVAGKIGVWEGSVHFAGDNFVHTYKIYVLGR
jgi:hypothetical protein